MADVRRIDRAGPAASFVLGAKLDSIPFGAYHMGTSNNGLF
jgi:hypothetical protein